MRNDRSLIARRKPQSFSSVEGHESRLQEFSRRFELLKPAVARFPRSSEIRLAYALACYFTGRNDLAEQAYLQLVQMQPNSDQSHFALGNFYADAGRLEEAAASFRRAIGKNPGNYLNHYMHGVALFRCQCTRA